jgi:predicted RNase H-like HicB family nuclease
MLEYHVAYFPIEDGWYLATVLDFPGVVTQGKTLPAARRMVRSALEEMAAWYMEEGESFPKPNPRARDRKAVLVEPIRLTARVRSGVIC